MRAIDHPSRLISWRAALMGGMCGIGVLAFFGTATYIVAYWLLLLTGTPSQKIYAALSDRSNVWLFSIGGCTSVAAALVAGFLSVRAGSASKLQALVAGLVCVAFVLLTMAYPTSPSQPHWFFALSVVELMVGSLIGGVLAVRSRTLIQRGDAMAVPGNLAKGLRTIGHGFLLGIGFTLVLGIFFAIAALLIQRQVERAGDRMNHPEMTRDAKIKDLELIDVQERKTGDRDYIIGTIKNNGDAPFQNIEIEADLFQAGKFVDKYSTDQSSPLAPGATAYFKIECGCKNSAPAEHDSFKTHIVSAF